MKSSHMHTYLKTGRKCKIVSITLYWMPQGFYVKSLSPLWQRNVSLVTKFNFGIPIIFCCGQSLSNTLSWCIMCVSKSWMLCWTNFNRWLWFLDHYNSKQARTSLEASEMCLEINFLNVKTNHTDLLLYWEFIHLNKLQHLKCSGTSFLKGNKSDCSNGMV